MVDEYVNFGREGGLTMEDAIRQMTDQQAEALAQPIEQFCAARASLFATNTELPFFERLRNEDPL